MSDLRLSLAISDYVHTADLVNGRVRPVGIEFTVLSLPFEAVTMRFGANLEFDIAEFSLANYCAVLGEARPAPIIALPIFTSRAFRHSAIYVNEASGIGRLEELKGRRVGIPQWSQTATVYLRGYLQHQIGVPLSSVLWVQAGVDQPGRRDAVQARLPKGVIVEERPDQTLNDMLLSGSVDAVVSARPPQCIVRNSPGVRRMFANPRLEEERYFAQTGIFPIMHVVAIRRSVYEANRWIARNIFDAFEAAKIAALARLHDAMTSYLPTAWAITEMANTHHLIFSNGNVWPYGLSANRSTLEPFLAYCHEQGITSRRLQCEELFAPEVNFEVRV
jgi:4,5-dihydroxyphthalate decarboxylase